MKTKRNLLASTVIAGVAAVGAPAGVAIITAVAPTTALAQGYTTGILSGTVEDESGAPIAGAAVSIRSTQGDVRNLTTDAQGRFRAPALAAGSYRVTITAPNYAATASDVTVEPGSDNNFTIAVGADTDASTVEGVVVTAPRRTAFSETDIGANVDVQELSQRVPVGRSIAAITLLSPGASSPDPTINASSRRNQSLVSLAGTSAAESVYYINGLNVTDQRTFLGYTDLPFEFIDRIEAKTGGYQAEFGRATGGVVNIVTRRGTNEWEGGVTATYSPDALRSNRPTAYNPGGNNSPGGILYDPAGFSESKEFVLWAGGPIIRDRLFVFGVYNPRDIETTGAGLQSTPTASTNTRTTFKYDDPRYAVKLDAILFEGHRLEATYISDKTETDVIQRRFNGPSTGFSFNTNLPLYTSEAGGNTYAVQYTGAITDWFTISALYGVVENAYRDFGPAANAPGIQEFGDPNLAPGSFATANSFLFLELAGADKRTTYRVDGDFYFNLFGDHHVRVGYDREDLESSAVSSYNGGGLYFAFAQADCPTGAGPAGCVNITTFANNGQFTAEQSALYIQDSWDVTDNLTLQLGLRNDRYDYRNAAGQSYINIEDQYAPRLGFSWDPLGGGADRVYGSYGRYYLPIALNTSIRASSGEIFTDQYFQTQRNPNGSLVIQPNGYPIVGAQIGPTDFFSPPGGPDPRQVTEEGIEPMFEEEYILGYEHRFREGMLADWSVGVRGIYRNLASTIEDTQIGDAVIRYCIRTNNATCVAADGTSPTVDPRDFGSLFPYVLINPGDAARVFVDLQADPAALPNGQPNPAYNPQFIELTAADLALPEVERTYKALEFTFERPFDGRWGLRGSYTLAESEGNYEGAVKSDIGQTDTSITQDFDHRANTLNSFGLLPNHHRHTFKIFGNVQVTEAFSIGANYTAQSGRPFSCIGYVPLSADQFAPQSGTPSGFFCPLGPADPSRGPNRFTSIPTPRGSLGETDWVHNVDLKLSYTLLETERFGSAVAMVDIFNLFDNDAVIRRVEQGEIRRSEATAKGERAPFYGYPRTYQSPRSVRFGLAYRF